MAQRRGDTRFTTVCQTTGTFTTGDTLVWGNGWDDITWTVPKPVEYQPGVLRFEIAPSKRKGKHVRTLFRVYAINPKGAGTVVGDVLVIAEDERDAEREAIVKLADSLRDARLAMSDVDWLVDTIGEPGAIRAKRQTQKVKVVDDEDD